MPRPTCTVKYRRRIRLRRAKPAWWDEGGTQATTMGNPPWIGNAPRSGESPTNSLRASSLQWRADRKGRRTHTPPRGSKGEREVLGCQALERGCPLNPGPSLLYQDASRAQGCGKPRRGSDTGSDLLRRWRANLTPGLSPPTGDARNFAPPSKTPLGGYAPRVRLTLKSRPSLP